MDACGCVSVDMYIWIPLLLSIDRPIYICIYECVERIFSLNLLLVSKAVFFFIYIYIYKYIDMYTPCCKEP